jgi:hypothetical protein
MLLTAAVLSALAGAGISLLFSYIPGLDVWYAAQTETAKKLVMLLIMFVIAGAVFAMNCFGLFTGVIPEVACTQQGVEQYIAILITAAVANQTTYKLTPTTKRVIRAKAARE